MKVAVIGGGAGGFFAAIAVAENYPDAEVCIFEKSQSLLSKVKVSGGGRCNVTNNCPSLSELLTAYPRGGKKLKKAFGEFDTQDSIAWFEARGVELKTEPSRCVFPVSDDSQTVIDCLLDACKRAGIRILTEASVQALVPENEGIRLEFLRNSHPSQSFDKVIVATGGSPKRRGLEWLESLGHKIEDPVPSLFTFNMPGNPIRKLMGLVAGNALVRIQGSKLSSEGPLLITHWGMSGPAILKLSAFGARLLSEMNYRFTAQVNWVGEANQEMLMQQLQGIATSNPNKILANIKPFDLPARLWAFLLAKADLPEQKKWGELGKKGLHKLVNILANDLYEVKGTTTFKEEFVTCGGVSLESIDMRSMQSKVVPGLYFCGEVMDIDAITGGYNFQAAWTTAWIAGKLR